MSATRFLTRICLFFVPLLLPWPAAAQFGRITFPQNGSIVIGQTLVSAIHLMTSINPNQVSSVQFEYSSDGISWSLIGVDDSPRQGIEANSPVDWDTVWDTEGITSGDYRIRARFYLGNGLIFTTPPIVVTVGMPAARQAPITNSSRRRSPSSVSCSLPKRSCSYGSTPA